MADPAEVASSRFGRVGHTSPRRTHVAERRGPTRKRRSLYRFESIHTLRYQYLHRAGVIVHPDGRPTLDVGCSPAVAGRFKRLDRLLKAA
jgi:hypothetical protein